MLIIILQMVHIYHYRTIPSQSIELPHTIPKSSFERDLDFYGLGSKEGEIRENSIPTVLASLKDAKTKHDMFLLAIEAHRQYAFHGSWPITVKSNDFKEKLGSTCSASLTEEEKAAVEDYLDVYFGLKVKSQFNSISPKHYCFYKKK